MKLRIEVFKEIFPDLEPPYLKEISKVVLTGNSMRSLEILSPVTGDWIEIDIYHQKDDNFAVFTRNITERKLAEKAIKIREEKYRQIVETTNEGIWEMDNQ